MPCYKTATKTFSCFTISHTHFKKYFLMYLKTTNIKFNICILLVFRASREAYGRQIEVMAKNRQREIQRW